mmetsp:Transcript_97816/g.273843  ORF Transcript_97816/g.273843 Transcript_97816/m.273843 type:complete len:248 (+) Transcript_97816:190-933(+)
MLGGQLHVRLRDSHEGGDSVAARPLVHSWPPRGVRASRLRCLRLQRPGGPALDGAHAQHLSGRDCHPRLLAGVRECQLEGVRGAQVSWGADDVVGHLRLVRSRRGLHLLQHLGHELVALDAAVGHRGGCAPGVGIHRRLGEYLVGIELVADLSLRLLLEVLPSLSRGRGLPSERGRGAHHRRGLAVRARLRGRGLGVAKRPLRHLRLLDRHRSTRDLARLLAWRRTWFAHHLKVVRPGARSARAFYA